MSDEQTVKYKSKKFAVRIVNLYKYLCDEKKEFTLSEKLLRSGTGIGADIARSECAINDEDFLSETDNALSECAETAYCLDLLFETKYLSDNEYESIKKDCVEIRKMLSSTTKTMNEKLHTD